METITSAKNPMVKRMRALKDRKARLESGRILVEGEVMLREALSCGLAMYDLAADEAHAALAEELAGRAENAAILAGGLLETVCETRSPQGVCATFDIPPECSEEDLPDILVALDGVQDPGNVGTIWRTADAAGFGGLLLGRGCADPVSPKVLRAAMGSGFRLRYRQCDPLEDTLLRLKARGYRVLASDLSGSDFYSRQPSGDRYVLVIGNEARGIRDVTRQLADECLKLPMRGGAESLNAAIAAAILMYGLINGR